MVLLEPNKFIAEVVKLSENKREANSLWLTVKRRKHQQRGEFDSQFRRSEAHKEGEEGAER